MSRRSQHFLPSVQFEHLELFSVSGGALLGERHTTSVDIAKSDYPNGKFGFKGQTELNIPNPDRARTLVITVERTGGLIGSQMVCCFREFPDAKSLPSTSVFRPYFRGFHVGVDATFRNSLHLVLSCTYSKIFPARVDCSSFEEYLPEKKFAAPIRGLMFCAKP